MCSVGRSQGVGTIAARGRATALAFGCCLGALCLLAASADARPGDRDPSFSRDGLKVIDLGGAIRNTGPRAVGVPAATFSNDSIVAAASLEDEGDFPLVRLRPNGSLKSAFGEGGIVEADWGGNDIPTDLLALDSGRVVVSGESSGAPIVARYLPNGRLDPGFGLGGIVRLDAPGGPAFSNNAARGLSLDSRGRIVVLARRSVFRLLPDGRADPAFGGRRSVPGFVRSTAVDAEDRVLVATNESDTVYDESFQVRRFRENGTSDASFAGNGILEINFNDLYDETDEDVPAVSGAGEIAARADGRTLVTGSHVSIADIYAPGHQHAILIDGDGGIDRDFGGSAHGTEGLAGVTSGSAGLVVAPDGASFHGGAPAAGGPGAGPSGDFSIGALDARGMKRDAFGNNPTEAFGPLVDDSTFGADFPFRSHDRMYDLAADSSDRLVASGIVFSGRRSWLGLARFTLAEGPANQDADRLIDDGDRCRSYFGPRRREGCPLVGRRIGLRTSQVGRKARFRGTVRSVASDCRRGAFVQIRKRRRGRRDRAVARLRTDFAGEFDLRRRVRRGRYYAKVRRSRAEPVAHCLADRSPLRRAR